MTLSPRPSLRRGILPATLLTTAGLCLWYHIYERGINSQKASSSLFKGLLFRLAHDPRLQAHVGGLSTTIDGNSLSTTPQQKPRFLSYNYLGGPSLSSSSSSSSSSSWWLLSPSVWLDRLADVTVNRNSILGRLNNVQGHADIRFKLALMKTNERRREGEEGDDLLLEDAWVAFKGRKEASGDYWQASEFRVELQDGRCIDMLSV